MLLDVSMSKDKTEAGQPRLRVSSSRFEGSPNNIVHFDARAEIVSCDENMRPAGSPSDWHSCRIHSETMQTDGRMLR